MIAIHKSIRNCTRCTEWPESINGRGNTEGDYIVVGIAPGFKELVCYYNRPGQFILSSFAECGLTEKNTYFTNVYKCATDKLLPGVNAVKECADHLDNEINCINPKLIIGLGNVGRKRLTKGTKTLQEARLKIFETKIAKKLRKVVIVTNPAALNNAKNDRDRFKATQNMLNEDFNFLHETIKNEIS